MRRCAPFFFAILSACAPEKQTATIGTCPEGSSLTDSGECEDDFSVDENNGDGTVDDGDGDGGGDGSGDDGGGDDGDSSEEEEEIPEDLDPLEEDVEGKSYAIDLSTAEWVEPDSPLLSGFLGDSLDVKVLMAVEEANEETLDLVGALPNTDSEDLVQDECLPTLDFDPIDFSDSPYFRVGPTNFPVEFMGISLTIWDMDISGIFEPDGGGMYDIGLAGALDFRDIGEALGDADLGIPIDLSDPDETCELLGTLLSIDCEDCPADGEPYCIEIELAEILADEVDVSVEPISEDEIDPECE